MKNTNQPASLFDGALKQASRDFAKEMGDKTESQNNSAQNLTTNRGMLSAIIEFLKSKMDQAKTIKHGKLKF